jgi:hypothetical protein
MINLGNWCRTKDHVEVPKGHSVDSDPFGVGASSFSGQLPPSGKGFCGDPIAVRRLRYRCGILKGFLSSRSRCTAYVAAGRNGTGFPEAIAPANEASLRGHNCHNWTNSSDDSPPVSGESTADARVGPIDLGVSYLRAQEPLEESHRSIRATRRAQLAMSVHCVGPEHGN